MTGSGVEFVAVRVIAATVGLAGSRAKLNSTLTPFFSKAVRPGMSGRRGMQHSELHAQNGQQAL